MFRLAIECGGGAPVVTARGVTLHNADLFEFKRNTATFVCKCPGSPDNHIVTRKVSGLRTPTTSDPRKLLPIEGYPFRIAVPEHMVNNKMVDGFDLGPIHFTYKTKGLFEVIGLVPDKPLPESWTIDIGESYEVL